MTDPLHKQDGERETIRVFALDLPATEAQALAQDRPPTGAPSPLADLLGVARLDRTYVELFPAEDLKGIGLSGYITEGLGVAATDLDGHRARLDAETGHLMIVHARAFDDAAVTLAPKSAARLVGFFRLEQADRPGLTLPDPAGPIPAEAPPDPRPGPPARLPRALVLIGLLGAAALVLLLAFLIGSGGR